MSHGGDDQLAPDLPNGPRARAADDDDDYEDALNQDEGIEKAWRKGSPRDAAGGFEYGFHGDFGGHEKDDDPERSKQMKIVCGQPGDHAPVEEAGPPKPETKRRRKRMANGQYEVHCNGKGKFSCCNPNVNHQFGRYCVADTKCDCEGCVDFKGEEDVTVKKGKLDLFVCPRSHTFRQPLRSVEPPVRRQPQSMQGRHAVLQ